MQNATKRMISVLFLFCLFSAHTRQHAGSVENFQNFCFYFFLLRHFAKCLHPLYCVPSMASLRRCRAKMRWKKNQSVCSLALKRCSGTIKCKINVTRNAMHVCASKVEFGKRMQAKCKLLLQILLTVIVSKAFCSYLRVDVLTHIHIEMQAHASIPVSGLSVL